MADDKKVSATFVTFVPFPEFGGKRVISRLKVKSPGNYKPELSLPVPENDEECMASYGLTIHQLKEKGTKQHLYDVSEPVRAWFQAQIDAGTEVNDIEGAPGNDLFVKVPREKVAGVAAANKTKAAAQDAFLKKHGVESLEELDAKIAGLAAKEAQASKKNANHLN